MEEQKMLNEYRQKARILFEDYKRQDKELMRKRRNYKSLDEGVYEEKILKEKYKQAQENLDNEYKDIIHMTK